MATRPPEDTPNTVEETPTFSPAQLVGASNEIFDGREGWQVAEALRKGNVAADQFISVEDARVLVTQHERTPVKAADAPAKRLARKGVSR